MEGSHIFGVVGGTVDEPRVAYLDEPQPVTTELLKLTEPVLPTEVFRFAAPCAGHGCRHFDGVNCQLATRTVNNLPEAVDLLPPCAIRPNCRWWKQEGKAACLRCPLVVTYNINPSDIITLIASPPATESASD
jgi:hypothetical protein